MKVFLKFHDAEMNQGLLILLTLVSRPPCCAKKREGKARSAGHSRPMAKRLGQLCFFDIGMMLHFGPEYSKVTGSSGVRA